MSVKKVVVKKNTFYDSSILMRAASEAKEKIEGVIEVAALMATDLNKKFLADVGLLIGEAVNATPSDLVIAVEAENEEAANKAIEFIEKYLVKGVETVKKVEEVVETLEDALEKMPDANIVVISTPGEYAGWEALKALEKGLHVLLFSSNVELEEEIILKKYAAKKGLLLMGPDAGTAIINGVGLGFANVVNKGPIGLVAAAGTGIQEVTSIITREGLGTTWAIGTGSRDPTKDVGAITMIEGLKALGNDDETKVVVIVSKPPEEEIAKKVVDVAAQLGKPVVVNFLGASKELVDYIKNKGLTPALTLEEAAYKAIALAKGEEPPEKIVFTLGKDEIAKLVEKEVRELAEQQKYVRGLYSGGTLASEAAYILKDYLKPLYANVKVKGVEWLEDPFKSIAHSIVDMGAEEFVTGRLHPMIDPTLRKKRILEEARDPEVAVILLDIVLGYGSHEDPAGALIPEIKQAKELVKREGRRLVFIASITGTDKDPQNYSAQKSKLEKAGVIVMPTNAQASRLAALIASKDKWREVLDKMYS